jgi:hypothetical protein
VVQIPGGKSSEVLGSKLVGGRDSVNEWVGKGGLRRARCNLLRKVAKDIMFLVELVHLQRNVMNMYLRNMNRYALEHPVVLERGYLGHALRPGIHMRGSVAQVSSIKGGPIVERWNSLTAIGCG